VQEDWENVHKVHAYLSAKRYMRYGWGPQIYNGSRDVTTTLSGTVCSPYAGTSYDRPVYQSNQTHDDGIYALALHRTVKIGQRRTATKMINDKKILRPCSICAWVRRTLSYPYIVHTKTVRFWVNII